jgi:hypothetical protein
MIDIENLTPEQAWKIFIDFNNDVDGHVNISVVNSRKFCDILVLQPVVSDRSVVSGYDIEYSDCFLYLMFRIPEVYNTWVCYSRINTWNQELSWMPEFVNFGDENEYAININSDILYKTMTK